MERSEHKLSARTYADGTVGVNLGVLSFGEDIEFDINSVGGALES